MLQRLFETLTRAEKLLEDGQEEERSKLVQRVAGEYTQLVYLLGKARAEGCQVVDTLAERVDKIRSRLSGELSQLLLDALEDASKLKQVLKTYEVIEGWEEAEEVIRVHFRQFCKQAGCDLALRWLWADVRPSPRRRSSNPQRPSRQSRPRLPTRSTPSTSCRSRLPSRRCTTESWRK